MRGTLVVSMRRKVIIWGAVSCLAAVVLFFLFASSGRVNTFRTLKVSKGPIAETLTETGTIRFAKTVLVKPTVSGEVRHVSVDIGDRITAGAVLAVIEPDPSQALQLSRQRARVDGARIDLSEQEMILNRKRALYERSLISSQEHEKAKIENTKALHKLRMAELELEILELKGNAGVDSSRTRDTVRILSPLSGIVIARKIEAGEVVVSGISSYTGGTEMFRIGDLERMTVRAAIGEIDAGRVRAGQAVRIRVDAHPNTVYRGRVERVSPVGVRRPGTTLVTFDTDIVISNPSPGLQQGMSCDIDIVVDEKDKSIRVPASSVLELYDVDHVELDTETGPAQHSLQSARRHAVYRCTAPDQEIQQCPAASLEISMVEIGIESIDYVEIISGIAPGTHIALDANAVRTAQNPTR